MDALFTTFLSSGMACPYSSSNWPIQAQSKKAQSTTLPKNCFLEFDLTNSSDEVLKKPYDDISYGSTYKSSKISMRGFTDSDDVMSTSLTEQVSTRPAASMKSTDVFRNYCINQMKHLAVQHRMKTTLLSECCLQFGTYSCSCHGEENPCCKQRGYNMDPCTLCENPASSGYCCCEVDMGTYHLSGACSVKMEPYDVAVDFPCSINLGAYELGLDCSCNIWVAGDHVCDAHNLLIQDMEISDKGCMYTIYFNATSIKQHEEEEDDDDEDDEDDEDGEAEQYFVNPCYDNFCKDFLDEGDETFEIEFSAAAIDSPIDTFGGFTDVHFTCGGDKDLFDIYDYSEFDEDMYDSDEDCCDHILQTGLVIASTWNSDMSNKNTVQTKSKSFPLARKGSVDRSQMKRSKYHEGCFPHSATAVSASNGSTPKKVHFAQADKLVTVHWLIAWPHSYRRARRSSWLKFAHNRAHFKRRIDNTNKILDPMLKKKLKVICRSSSSSSSIRVVELSCGVT